MLRLMSYVLPLVVNCLNILVAIRHQCSDMSPTQRGTKSLSLGTSTMAEEHNAEEAQPNKNPSGFSRKPYNAGN